MTKVYWYTMRRLRTIRDKIARYDFYNLLSRELRGAKAILDVGCGDTSSIRHIKTYKVGVDHCLSHLERSRREALQDDYIVGDIRFLPFRSKSFDCVVATEVLEHLSKEDGWMCLEELERVACNKVVLTTPNGFLNVPSHLSGWIAKELKAKGYKVYGMHGLRFLYHVRGGRAVPKSLLFASMAGLSQFLTYWLPDWAFGLFAIKKY